MKRSISVLLFLSFIFSLLPGCAVQDTPAPTVPESAEQQLTKYDERDTISYKDETYTYIEFPHDVFCYDLAKSVECEEDEICPISSDKWSIVFCNGDLFALNSQLDDITAYFSNDDNYRWHATVEDVVEVEPEYSLELTLTEDEIRHLYTLEDQPKEEAILFEDIEKFAVFSKTSNDGLITAWIDLALYEGIWYWRSSTIDENTEGWPEYVIPLPCSVSDKLFQN